MTQKASAPLNIPEYPYWKASQLEVVWGAEDTRYLPMSKAEAVTIMARLPTETAVADHLFGTGSVPGDLMAGRTSIEFDDDVSPQDIWDTLHALLTSFGPSHEVKIATVAVALYRWFPPKA